MRGIFLQQPLEFRLDVTGDSFTQGAQLPCSLTIKNHSDQPIVGVAPTVTLSIGNLKKVKSRSDDAFEQIEVSNPPCESVVPPRGEIVATCTFSLDRNAPISDKNQSPYLLYGSSHESQHLGQLLLTIHPHPHIRTIFDTMTTVFNFINKGEVSKGGVITAKLKAPDSRRFSFVEELNLSASFAEDALNLTFLFTVKKFDHGEAKVGVKKGKTEVQKALPSAEYLFGGGFVRQEYIEHVIESALSEVSSGL